MTAFDTINDIIVRQTGIEGMGEGHMLAIELG